MRVLTLISDSGPNPGDGPHHRTRMDQSNFIMRPIDFHHMTQKRHCWVPVDLGLKSDPGGDRPHRAAHQCYRKSRGLSTRNCTLVIICRSHIGVLRLNVGQIYRQITIDQF